MYACVSWRGATVGLASTSAQHVYFRTNDGPGPDRSLEAWREGGPNRPPDDGVPVPEQVSGTTLPASVDCFQALLPTLIDQFLFFDHIFSALRSPHSPSVISRHSFFAFFAAATSVVIIHKNTHK